MSVRWTWALTTALALAAGACSDDGPSAGGGDSADAASDATDAGGADGATSDAASDGSGEAAPPFAELAQQGVTRYLGAFPPTEVRGDASDRTHVFDYAVDAEGPACLRGATYHVATRATASSDLLIFMQGGGACWSDFCFAIEEAGADGVPTFDTLDPENPHNPFADWNVLYLPYCDGSLFAGDISYDADDDGEPDRIHRGLQNLSAGIDVATTEFEGIERIMLAGSSGGGFGTIIGAPLVRTAFPDAELLVFNDAGVGVAKADEPEFLAGLVDEFGARAFVPASCPDCLDSGHLTPLVRYALEQDPALRVAAFSSYEDSVIATIFLDLPRGEFEEQLLIETGALSEAFPGRYAPFLIDGKQHTVLLGDIRGFLGDGFDVEGNPFESLVELGSVEDTVVGDVSVEQWTRWMLAGDDRWQPVIQMEEE